MPMRAASTCQSAACDRSSRIALLRDHLERRIEADMAKGITADEARYAALHAFGGIEQRKEECRDTRAHNSSTSSVRTSATRARCSAGTRASPTADNTIGTTQTAIRARVPRVSDDFWEIAHPRLAFGRVPAPGEPNVLLLSCRLFEREFQSNPSIVGSTGKTDLQDALRDGTRTASAPVVTRSDGW